MARLTSYHGTCYYGIMNTITIPKKITRGEELVIILRKEYERFLRLPGAEKGEKGLTELAVEEGLRDLHRGRVTPAFPSVREFKRFLKKK